MMTLPYTVPDGQVLRTPHIIGSNIGPAKVIGSGAIRSENYVAGTTGWSIDGDGNVEFSSGTFRGAIVGSTIDIGGSDATSFHVDADGNMWLGAGSFASGPFRVSNAGDVTINGNVTLDSNGVLASDDARPRVEFRHSTNPYTPGEAVIAFLVGGAAPSYEAQLRTSGQELWIQGPGNLLFGQVAEMRLSDPANVATMFLGAEAISIDSNGTFEVLSETSLKFWYAGVQALDLGGAWTSYTPAWTSSGVAPVLGNGTLTGQYFRVGKTAHVRIRLVPGTTTTFGTGNYYFSTPFTMPTSWPGIGSNPSLGGWRGYDANTFNGQLGWVTRQTATTIDLEYAAPVTSIVGQTSPWTWANADAIDIWFTQEIA